MVDKVNQKNLDKLLTDAIEMSDLKAVKRYLREGANVNACNINTQETCLHIAAQTGDKDIFSILLAQNSANIYAVSYDNGILCDALPIHYAAYYGHEDIIYQIITHDDGQCINKRDGNGFTPLHEAIDQNNLGVIKNLLNHPNINVNVPTARGDGDTDFLVPIGSRPLTMAIILDQPETVKYLLALQGIDITLQATNGYSFLEPAHFECEGARLPGNSNVLHLAAILKREEIIKLLLSYLSVKDIKKVNDKSYDECTERGNATPFEYAVETNKENLILLFIQSGKIADINAYVDGVNNILHLACQYGWIKILQALATIKEVKFNLPNKVGHTIIKLAKCEEVLAEIHKISKTHNVDPNAFDAAAYTKRVMHTIAEKRKQIIYEEKLLGEETEYLEFLPADMLLEQTNNIFIGEDCSENRSIQTLDKELSDSESEDELIISPAQIGREENQPLLISAAKNNTNILWQLLQFDALDLEVRGDEGLRAISLAKAILSTTLSKEERCQLKRLKNDISVNLRRRNIKGLKERLDKYSTDDLNQLLKLAGMHLGEKILLEGYINFTVYEGIKGKRQPISPEKMIYIIKKLIKKRKVEISKKPTLLTKMEVFNYILLEAAHSIFNQTNCTSGEELEPKIEKTLAEKRKSIWQQATLPNNNIKYLKKPSSTVKKFIPIFRGINFMRDLFELQDRYDYEQQACTKSYFASHGCYYLLGKEPHDRTVSIEQLTKKANYIEKLMYLLDSPETVKLFDSEEELRGCKTLLRRLQMLYTENINGFNYDVFDNITKSESVKQKIKEKFPWFEQIFTKNPFVSGSIIPMHSIRYALGMSRANANTDLLLDPRYDFSGKPKYPCVGMVFIALYPKDEYQALYAVNIPKAFAQGEFILKCYHQLLPEAEITMPGILNHVVVSIPIEFPNFEISFKEEVCKNFSLSKRKYNKIAEGIKQKRGTLVYRNAITSLKKHLVDYYDKNLLTIAQNYAKQQGRELEFELPDGVFTNIAPKPSEIRDMAINLSPLVDAKKTKKRKHEIYDDILEQEQEKKLKFTDKQVSTNASANISYEPAKKEVFSQQGTGEKPIKFLNKENIQQTAPPEKLTKQLYSKGNSGFFENIRQAVTKAASDTLSDRSVNAGIRLMRR